MTNTKNQRRLTDSIRKAPSIISEGSILLGTLAGADDYVIYGSVDGTCDLGSALMLQKSGRWVGEMVAENIVIAGKVEGNVTARDKLELTASARIEGNISGKTIAIAEGAVVEGNISMTNEGDVSYFVDHRVKK